MKRTARWLADELDISDAAVSRWKKDGNISRANAVRVANLLGISVDQLIGVTVSHALVAAEPLPSTSPRTEATDSGLTTRDELVLFLWSHLSPEQEDEWLSELRALSDANREIAKHYGGVIRTAPNERVARAYGAIPLPARSKRGPPTRPRPETDVDPAAGDILD